MNSVNYFRVRSDRRKRVALFQTLYVKKKKMPTPYNTSFACFECHKSFKREFDLAKEYPLTLKCPNCGGVSHNFGRHFKAPKRTDKKQWGKVKYLYDHGFYFHKIYDQNNNGELVPYPETLEEAKEFVDKYKEYALQRNI